MIDAGEQSGQSGITGLAVRGNMAVDEALLVQAVQGRCEEPLVRIYRWDPPTLSVGANLELPEAIRERCEAAGVAVVRRATGGGCVLHDGDVTYSVVAPERGRGVLEAYRWVAGGLSAGLATLGLQATVAEHPTRGRPLNCFQWATGADLEVGGRKICGSAQVRRRGWFLQHGSIPISDIRDKTAGLLGGTFDERSTCLERIRPGTSWEEVADALIVGFSAAWEAPPRRSTGLTLRDPLGMV